ncbi:hypothetical protein [Sporisorium scitamineum]|uniref:Uncharacterized protein n=1 Tax=Sporisorium scitamineum TaxID=49012 RepID=A0A0F7RTK4_9BASI|nr:hypothetical protein [Sporisorium scitamineum]
MVRMEATRGNRSGHQNSGDVWHSRASVLHGEAR